MCRHEDLRLGVTLSFENKDSQIEMGVSKPLLDDVKARAKARGIPYARVIRETRDGRRHECRRGTQECERRDLPSAGSRFRVFGGLNTSP